MEAKQADSRGKKQRITIRTKVDEQTFLRNSHKRKRMALPPLAAARTHKLDDAAEFILKKGHFCCFP